MASDVPKGSWAVPGAHTFRYLLSLHMMYANPPTSVLQDYWVCASLVCLHALHYSSLRIFVLPEFNPFVFFFPKLFI